MSKVAGVFRFLWDFVVGDDPLAAAAIAALLAVMGASRWAWATNMWWLLPLGVLATLAHGLRRARRARLG